MRTLHVRPVAALAAVLASLVAASASAQPRQGRDPQSSSTIVVVPFENLTGAAVDAWIGAGIAESLATGFPSGSAVVASLPSGPLALPTSPGIGSDVTLAEESVADRALEVARGLGAQFVVSGAYQRLGESIRITGRLVDLADVSVVRAAKVDGVVGDLFALQDQIVAALSGPLPAAGMRAEATTTTAPVSPMPRADQAPATPAAAPVAPMPLPAVAPGGVASAGLAVQLPSGMLASIQGPPPPVAPAVMTRDEEGRTTVRAIRLSEGIRLDGELDEAVYAEVPAITDFLQQVPVEGAPATEKTDAWIMFDDTNVYVSARVWDSAPESEWVANEMRRDTSQLRQNDTFAVFFDTFYDRRNGFNFYTNPLGARADQQFTNEGNPNSDWNPVWDVRTGRFDGGWTVEMEIPFKTLRYRSGPAQVWGVQLRRAIRRKNEWVYLTRLPISAGGGGGSSGIFRVSSAGTLVGIEPPEASRNIEVKPYAIGNLTRDTVANPGGGHVRDGDFGLDVKYGITQNLTADLTYNTDFAQVEVDEQQVNLTRFSLFFPEKREFFLEGRGVFDFARGGIGGAGPGGGGGGFFGGGNAPTLFYSRRIGLDDGQVVPILGGGRVTGKIGQFNVGALSISTDDKALGRAESTNFTAVRVKRDILRRSAIGGMLTNRSVSVSGDGSSQTYGLDGTFAFYENIQMLGYYARTETPDPEIVGENTSYQAKFEYAADRYGMQVDHLLVEDDFNPEIGFLRRDNFRRTFVEGRFSPRPRSIDSVRQVRFIGSVDYILTADTNLLETRTNQLAVQTEFENSDRFAVTLRDNYELLLEPFSPRGGDFSIPVGGYAFNDVEVAYSLGQQRRVNGGVTLLRGGYFGGDITTLGITQGRIAVLPQMSIEPSISFNWIDTPQGTFRTDLAVTRINYAFNPRMFFSGLLQYNSANDTVSSNMRFRWEYSPGSEIFVVYSEDRDTETLRPERFTELRNRGFVVKFNRLFRF
jgi:TolB-like protein